MLLTPFVYLINERIGSKLSGSGSPDFDDIPEENNEVIIAGFGRVGQIVGRLLRSIGKPFTALEIDSSQVDIVRRYGNAVHFGDAARSEVLRAAGAARAKILVIATADMETSLHIAETAKRQFPNLTIVARAHNRRHAHKLMDVGIEQIFRDTLLSSLAMGESVLSKLGLEESDIRHVSDTFREADAGFRRQADPVREGRGPGTRIDPREGPGAARLAHGRSAAHRHPQRDDLAR
jgi:glutathione-regulated potassium-efflux system protein KefB